MTSQRNSGLVGPRPPAPNRVADDVLLDAARDCVLSVGVRRTTLTDIAKRAGTSRMTLYRRFPGVTSVVAALMTREFGLLLGQIGAAATGGPDSADGADSARHRLVRASVLAAQRLTADPLMSSVLERDGELLLPYLVGRIGSTQRLAERFITDQLTAGHADGSVRPGPVTAQTRVFFLTVQAFVISHRPAASDVPDADLLAELAASLDHSLRPERESPHR